MTDHSTETSLPKISGIKVEYSDGSYDTIKLLQEGELTLYSLDRISAKRPVFPAGAYTSAEVAGLLYVSLMTTLYTEYSVLDKRFYDLLQAWRESLKNSYN
jgi:hypothetical protein